MAKAELSGIKIFNNLAGVHVHARGGKIESHKGTIRSETGSGVAGGWTHLLLMPNTKPPRENEEILNMHIAEAQEETNCIVGFYAVATEKNANTVYKMGDKVCGLKIYMDDTTGSLKITDSAILEEHFKNWTGAGPICVHAEEEFGSLSKALFLAHKYNRRLHICHVTSKEEVELIRKAKELGWRVTCEVTPHHLLLTEDNLKELKGYGVVKPRLKTKEDIDYLWWAVRMGIIDIIADDHAPHTISEKESSNPPSGIPGLETTIPLMLTAVNEGRITPDRLIEMISINPRKIFNLHDIPETYTVIDVDKTYYLDTSQLKTKCGHSPYKDHKMTGAIKEVCIKGELVYEDGKVFDHPDRENLVMQNYGN